MGRGGGYILATATDNADERGRRRRTEKGGAEGGEVVGVRARGYSLTAQVANLDSIGDACERFERFQLLM